MKRMIRTTPKGKYLFGVVTVGDKGQIVIPARARKVFGISAGVRLFVLGQEGEGLAMVKTDDFLEIANVIREKEKKHVGRN